MTKAVAFKKEQRIFSSIKLVVYIAQHYVSNSGNTRFNSGILQNLPTSCGPFAQTDPASRTAVLGYERIPSCLFLLPSTCRPMNLSMKLYKFIVFMEYKEIYISTFRPKKSQFMNFTNLFWNLLMLLASTKSDFICTTSDSSSLFVV